MKPEANFKQKRLSMFQPKFHQSMLTLGRAQGIAIAGRRFYLVGPEILDLLRKSDV
jgi:hypothetical protein